MSDNFNINTTQDQANEAQGLEKDNPAMTYVDFGNQISRNATEQARQAQLVQQAVEQTKQQQLGTKQKFAADAMGVNPEMKDAFTIDEAVAYLKAAGIDNDDIQAFVDSLGEKQTVNKSAIDTIIRKKELSVKTSVLGKKFTTRQDIQIPEGVDAKDLGLVADPDKPGVGHVPSDGEYQVAIDPSSGQPVRFVPLGETPDESKKAHDKEAADAEKQWQKLDTEMNKFIRSSRGNALTQAAQRSVRALNELGEGQPLTPQVLSFIQKDMSGIFQGGVPPVTGMDSEDFTTVYQKIQGLIQKYSGVSGALFHHDIGNQRSYLLGLLMRLRESTGDMLKSALASEASGYQGIIDTDPDRWKTMIQGKIDATNAGLSKNAQTTMDAMKETPAGALPPAMTPKGTGGDLDAKKAALRAKLDAMLKPGK